MNPRTLDPAEMNRLLIRKRRIDSRTDQLPADEIFEQILRSADRFVPAEAGRILIDDPLLKLQHPYEPRENHLVLVGGWGDGVEDEVGQQVPIDGTLAGETYITGRANVLSDLDPEQIPRLQQVRPGIETHSVISVPILIGRSTCGVLELINRRTRGSFQERDLELLSIFAAYISTALQNVLDANRYFELSKRDDLTGLYNDRYFNQALSAAIERAIETDEDLALIFLDLDHFKQINDKHGHLIGSQTLREVGLILRGRTTPDNAIIARYGGDEFVMVVPGCNESKALELAEQIRERIATAVFHLDQGIEGSGVIMVAGVLTASIGVASYRPFNFPDDTRLLSRKNAIIRCADQAMYEAKSDGKNRVCGGVYDHADVLAMVHRS